MKIKFLAFLIPVFLTSCYQVKNAENNFFESQSISEDSNNYNENINRKVLNDFYTAFKNGNAEGMVKLYHNDVEFEDPAFGLLKGERAKNMWRMLIERSKGNIKIDFNRLRVNKNTGTANWNALYNFSTTGNQVYNKVNAQFIFKDGLIYRHKDNFDLGLWSKQAFGFTGLVFGKTEFFKKKLNEEANKGLDKFIEDSKK